MIAGQFGLFCELNWLRSFRRFDVNNFDRRFFDPINFHHQEIIYVVHESNVQKVDFVSLTKTSVEVNVVGVREFLEYENSHTTVFYV